MPAWSKVVSEDLGISSQKLTSEINSNEPSYITDEIRKVGARFYHLFGRSFDDIVALQKVAKILQGGVDRTAVSELNKRSDDVIVSFGKGAADILNGANVNAKVCPPPPPLRTPGTHV